jgi:hypothetical protein
MVKLIIEIGGRSVVGRFIQSTFWPTLLSCDTAADRKQGVQAAVVFMTYTALFSTGLIAIAGVAAPIGLGESTSSAVLVNASFGFASDPSIFGEGTIPRENYTISRSCCDGSIPCPGVNPWDKVEVAVSTVSFQAYLSYVPENITTCFSSGTEKVGDTRSSPWDIQFRKYWAPSKGAKSPIANTTGDFSMLESVVLLDRIDVREGVIIDAINGSLGFRNHSVPTNPRMKYGATWTEDLLWLDPVTACADTNWTIQTRPQLDLFTSYTSTWLILINRGFANTLGQSPPDISFDELNSQKDPDLPSRASLAAQQFGLALSADLQLTKSNSSIGMRYNISEGSTLMWNLNQFGTSSLGLFLGQIPPDPYVQPRECSSRFLPSFTESERRALEVLTNANSDQMPRIQSLRHAVN